MTPRRALVRIMAHILDLEEQVAGNQPALDHIEAIKQTAQLVDVEIPSHLGNLVRDHTKTPKPLVGIDFDGVLHSYKSGWIAINMIPDAPNVGALEWLAEMMDQFTVVIFSARCNDIAGIIAMREWMVIHKFPLDRLVELVFQPGKPSFFLIVDDRALTFTGDFSELAPKELAKFRPWYYRHPEWQRPQ